MQAQILLKELRGRVKTTKAGPFKFELVVDKLDGVSELTIAGLNGDSISVRDPKDLTLLIKELGKIKLEV